MVKFFGLVFGSQPEQPKTLEVNVDTVYVRNNIERVEKEDFEGWKYEETQYNLKEFQEVVGEQVGTLENYSVDMMMAFAIQSALVEQQTSVIAQLEDANAELALMIAELMMPDLDA